MQSPEERGPISVKYKQSVKDKYDKINWLTPTAILTETKIVIKLIKLSQKQVFFLKTRNLPNQRNKENMLNVILAGLVSRACLKI